MCYYAADKPGKQWFMISKEDLAWSRSDKSFGWNIKGYPKGDFNAPSNLQDRWSVDNPDLHFQIRLFAYDHDLAEQGVELVTKKQWE